MSAAEKVPGVVIPRGYEPRLKLREVLVTPDMALTWLTERNNRNRRIREARVKEYADAMQHGRWMHTGESIIFDRQGQLLDGQHRLKAIFDAGVSVWCVLVEGVDPEAFSHIDTGAKRTTADVLDIAGYRGTTVLAAAARLCIHLEKIEAGQMPFLRLGSKGPASEEILAWINDHPELSHSLKLPPSRNDESVWQPPSLFRALHWRTAQASREDAASFFQRLADGVGLVGDDPILRLREMLLAEITEKRRGKRPHWYKAAMALKAWNAYREGRPLKHLRFQTGGRSPDPWPTPK